MSYAEYALTEFDHEMAGTRKVLERIPDDKLDWKAHPKSNTIGWNANHLADLPGWAREGDAIVATIQAPDFPAAVRLVVAVADEAEQMNHHPDIDIRWRTTRWLLTTHDAGGLTQLDVELAHRINAAARAEGAELGG